MYFFTFLLLHSPAPSWEEQKDNVQTWKHELLELNLLGSYNYSGGCLLDLLVILGGVIVGVGVGGLGLVLLG